MIGTSLVCITASAQVTVSDPELLGKPLAAIEISGNKITAEEIILRELIVAIGDAVTMAALELDQLRVTGLDLFSRVQFNLISRDGLPVLRIEVTEEWYIFPLPFWSYSDDDPPELTYGFRYRQKNFRGRNETLTASLWGGADRGFRFSHDTPWVRGTPTLTRRIELFQTTRKSKNLAVRDLNLESQHTAARLAMGKRWTREFTSELGVRFRLVQADNSLQLAGDGSLDRIIETFIVAAWDGRDLRQLPRRGFYLGTSLIQGYILSSSQQYQRFLIDIRTYIPYHYLSYCFRVQWLPGWGTVPPYDYIIVENTVPIRSSNLLDEGESFFMATFETRFDIYPLRYFTWHEAPFLKQYFRNLQYGLAAEIFVDVGDVYPSEGTPSVDTLMWGYGLGLLIRVPYADVLRLECSWNPEYSFDDVHFSWKLGVSF
jgi:outer membrane protein assembly factor BamA